LNSVLETPTMKTKTQYPEGQPATPTAKKLDSEQDIQTDSQKSKTAIKKSKTATQPDKQPDIQRVSQTDTNQPNNLQLYARTA